MNDGHSGSRVLKTHGSIRYAKTVDEVHFDGGVLVLLDVEVRSDSPPKGRITKRIIRSCPAPLLGESINLGILELLEPLPTDRCGVVSLGKMAIQKTKTSMPPTCSYELTLHEAQ